MKRRYKLLLGLVITFGALASAGWVIYGGGRHQGPGVVHPDPLPAAIVAARAERQRAVTPLAQSKQILFGDLHVHTTFSADAFMRSLPFLNGEGVHPPADACDYARFCSDLDFFALTDHAESLTPQHWRESIDSIRQCDAVAGGGDSPDLVPFLGYEWSQVGATPEEHYGHKNVIFPELDDDSLPPRPIASAGVAANALGSDAGVSRWQLLAVPIREFSVRQRYLDLAVYMREVTGVPACPAGVDTRELPADCRELAATPQVLFEKLAQSGLEAMVIPHGTTWGFYTPPGYTYDKQLTAPHADPQRQWLIEVYSGHGNSEEYRPWRAVDRAADGTPICPEPTDGYEPCCWRAGELIRARCGDLPADECEQRVVEARANYAAAGVAGHRTVPGATTEAWAGCGQCLDCFNPAFNYRPGGSVQYILARGGQLLGFIASSDNHSARPGTGFKELHRRKLSEAAGPRSAEWRDRFLGAPEQPAPRSRGFTREDLMTRPPFLLVNLERQASFFMTGGLVAVHSEGRGRRAIWDAMARREVYGTSGERILLWFDAVAGDGSARPMGSELRSGAPPRFVVRAAGAFEQLPGCPEHSERALGADRLARVCADECYNPSDRRRRITRVEVVRIRAQRSDDEPVASLIDDPWLTLPCEQPGELCEVTFEDPDFPAGARDVFYYVRAIQEPTPAVNAGGVRCEGDGCMSVAPCYGDWRTDYTDDCLADNEERAWSSPILVRYEEAAP